MTSEASTRQTGVTFVSNHYMSRLFGRSPVKPIQEHFEQTAYCAMELVPFFQAVIEKDWGAATEARKRIAEFEDAADDLKQEFRLNLPKGMFMPVSRVDLLDLISMQDRIANKAKDISGLVIGRKMQLPETVADDYLDFLRCSLKAVAQAQQSVAELDELFETGFRGREVDLMIDMTEELGRIESQADRMQIDLRAQLFRIENELPPVDVMFLYKIFEWTGDLGDLAQGVGGRLHLMISS